MPPTTGYSVIEQLAPFAYLAALVLPLFFVVWQAVFLLLLGSRRHLRSFGVSCYVSGLSLLMGGIIRSGESNHQSVLVVFLVAFVLGLLLALMALIVRENERGDLVFPQGPSWARIAGVTAYLSSAYLAFDLSRLGG